MIAATRPLGNTAEAFDLSASGRNLKLLATLSES